jgi:hypothetical protein
LWAITAKLGQGPEAGMKYLNSWAGSRSWWVVPEKLRPAEPAHWWAVPGELGQGLKAAGKYVRTGTDSGGWCCGPAAESRRQWALPKKPGQGVKM